MFSCNRRQFVGQCTKARLGYVSQLSRDQLIRRTLTDLADRRKAIESKYSDKLHERAKREGVASLDELKTKVTSQRTPSESVVSQRIRPKSAGPGQTPRKVVNTPVRKDSSPIKPLADFMDLKKILIKDHTSKEVSTLWTAYHATRSQGTGRGYLAATIPLDIYLKMVSVAKKYSSFLLPLPRPAPEPEAQDPAHEFHFLQWGFHEVPPHPAETPVLPFEDRPPPPPVPREPNPASSTVLFTPLQEYKLRQTFAQPHLVLTHYTDLATTHGIVLMRGELTPSPSSPEKYLLSQADAQLLAMGVQRFYLGSDDDKSGRRTELLRKFHERPAEFRWEDLLVFADPTV